MVFIELPSVGRELQRSPRTPESVGPAKPQIIFVDDDPRSIDDYYRTVRRKQSAWSCLFFMSAFDALAELGDHPSALLVMDSEVPQFDGIELLQIVRSINPDARVILTCRGREVARAAARSVIRNPGPTDILIKPFQAGELIRAIEELCFGK